MRNALILASVSIVLLGILFCTKSLAAEKATPKKPIPIIFDTDMGNDIDDALALSLIHSLQNRGECELLAVTITKSHECAASYTDIVNTFYGRGNIPVGIVHDGKTPDLNPKRDYIQKLSECTDGDTLRYPRTMNSGADAMEATDLLRKTLAGAEDGSVVVVQVGFSTNLARLLASKPDKYSPLSGKDLVAKKVRLLSLMAGSATEELKKKRFTEYNVKVDIPAAQRVFHDWPTPILMSGWEVGNAIKYPATSILQDYSYVEHHPVAEGYELYLKMPYDRQTWDLTSVLVTIRPDRDYFGLSQPGRITVHDDGYTSFEPRKDGNCRYLTVTPEQAARVRETFIHLCSEPPKK